MSYPQRNGQQHNTRRPAGRPPVTGEPGRTAGLGRRGEHAMNDGSGGRGSGGRGGLVRRWRRRAGVLVIVAGLAMLAAGCSSGPSPSRASYTACLRQHGVTGAALASVPGMSSRTSSPTSMPTPGSGRQVPARVSAAMQACQSLAPAPGQSPGPG
jgi:hypothetical protein